MSNLFFQAVSGSLNQGPIIPPTGGTKQIFNQTDFDNLVIEPGDIIEFQRGGVFRGSKTSMAPDVQFKDFGSGNEPIIKGSEILTGWADEGGNVHSVIAPVTDWVWFDDIMGRWAETAWIKPTNITTNQITINPADVSQYTDIVGSTLVGKRNSFRMTDQYTVIAYVPGTGVITLDRDYETTSNIDFKLYGKAEYLQQANDWAYEGGKVYVYSADPTLRVIERSAHNDGFKCLSSGNTITGLDFRNYYKRGAILNAANSFVNQCKFSQIRHQAAEFSLYEQTSGLAFNNNQVEDCGFMGVHVGPNPGFTLENNTFNNIGIAATYGWDNKGNAYTTNGNTACRYEYNVNNETQVGGSVVYRGNTVTNVAYNGLQISHGDNNLIENNVIHDFMLRFSDGGGIYVNHRPTSGFGNFTEIRNNIIYNGFADTSGVAGEDIAVGIYCDARYQDANIHDNVMYELDHACWLTNSTGNKNHTFQNNICIADRYDGILIRTGTNSNVNDGHTFSGNIFAMRVQAEVPYLTLGTSAGYNPWTNGSSNNNYLFNPFGVNYINDFGTLRDEAGLKAAYGQEANSRFKTNWLTWVDETEAKEQVKLYTNETDTNVQQLIPAGYEDIDGNDVSGQTLTVPARYGLLVLKSA